MKISIRPVTLRRVVEILALSVKEGHVDPYAFSEKLQTTRRRMQEILLEIERMKFLVTKDNNLTLNKIAYDFLVAFNDERLEKMHDILLSNYCFYGTFIDAIQRNISNSGFTKSDLLRILKNSPTLNFNITAIEVLCDWAERLGVVQRNLFTNRYYLTKNSATLAEFILFLQTSYEELNIKPRPGLRQEYVEIVRLREDVCEKLKIKRETFDLLLTSVFKKAYGKIELCGAPITTIAKKSPTSLRKVKKSLKDSMLSSQFVCLKESRGIEINGKEYYYIAIFEPLR